MKQEKEAIRTGIYIDREILNRADEAMKNQCQIQK